MSVPQTKAPRPDCSAASTIPPVTRVVVIGPVYPYRGAIAYCTQRLAKELRATAEVSLLSFSRQYPAPLYPGQSDVDPTVRDLAPAGARYALDVLNPLTWLREGLRLRREKPDVVVICWWVWVWAIPYLVITQMLCRSTRLFVQCHNIDDKEPRWWKGALANRLFRRADLLIVHSARSVEEVRERLGNAGVEKTVQLFLPVIPIGREIPERNEAKRRLGLENRKIAMFFGQIRPFKGLDIALRAWREVDGDILLLVVGEIWFGDEPRYRKIVSEEGLEDRVLFVSRYVPDAEVADYFSAADVVIASYRYENQSGVAMNAFHFGRPVIATAVGGLPDIIEHGVNGMLVPPADPEQLALAVNRFFDSEDRPRLEQGARAAAAKYSWERYGSAVAERLSL